MRAVVIIGAMLLGGMVAVLIRKRLCRGDEAQKIMTLRPPIKPRTRWGGTQCDYPPYNEPDYDAAKRGHQVRLIRDEDSVPY